MNDLQTSIEQINAFLFTIHIILFGVKIWATYTVATWFIAVKAPAQNSYMFIFNPWYFILFLFSISFTVVQAWYLSTFFITEPVPKYEYFAVLDEAFYTFIFIFYLTKEVKNGKTR